MSEPDSALFSDSLAVRLVFGALAGGAMSVLAEASEPDLCRVVGAVDAGLRPRLPRVGASIL